MLKCHFVLSCSLAFFLTCPAVARSEDSRAAWRLRGDGVEPVADLQNQSEPGQTPKFVDRVGQFSVIQDGDALVLKGAFQPNIWRFDTTTFDGQFDMKRLYVPDYKATNPDPDSLWSAELRRRFGEGFAFATGPWEIYETWRVPTARVSLDGQHVYTNWFDLPSLEDQAAGRVYASFALDIRQAGEHTVRIAFAPFTYNTRAKRADREVKAEVFSVPNPLKPDQIASIAIGVDERTRSLRRIPLRNELLGKHPRLSGTHEPLKVEKLLDANDPQVQKFVVWLDPDRGENWEYNLSEESMASDNDMDLGKKLSGAAAQYDRLVPQLTPEAKKAADEMFVKRADGFYKFCVFQRNYHPTGYAQNHASCAQRGLISAGLAFDGPLAEKWLDWAVALYSKRVELLGKDGSVEFMNEGRGYGLGFWQDGVNELKRLTGIDLARGPFFENEWRFAMHNSPSFKDYAYAKHGVPVPDGVTPDDLPTDWHFDDADQIYMRSDWTDQAYRACFWSGPPFGHSATDVAKRYNFAHYRINQGSFVLAKGASEILLEPNATRDYRKSATGANCIIVNKTDQWGGGQVWHPKLKASQYGRIAMFADGELMSVARGDLGNAYPPTARILELSRLVVHLKPSHYLVFDRVRTEGPGEAEWRYHAACIEPQEPATRFKCFWYKHFRQGKTPDEIFVKVPEVALDAAFLYPPSVQASVGMTEMCFRWQNSRPARHIKLVQKSDEGALQLLAAFGPDLGFKPLGDEGRGFQCQQGPVTWTILVGRGAAGALKSDGLFAAAAENGETGQLNLFRWGGKSVSCAAVSLEEDVPDLFISAVKDRAMRKVTTLKGEGVTGIR
jgi:hypothetical protein